MKLIAFIFFFILAINSFSETLFLSINFRENSTDTVSCKSGDGSTISQIQELAKILVDNPQIVLTLSGHADSNEHHKKRFSRKRAEFIKQILITEFKINPKRLITEGYSDKRLIISDVQCSEDKENCRCVNRRVSAYAINKDF